MVSLDFTTPDESPTYALYWSVHVLVEALKLYLLVDKS